MTGGHNKNLQKALNNKIKFDSSKNFICKLFYSTYGIKWTKL